MPRTLTIRCSCTLALIVIIQASSVYFSSESEAGDLTDAFVEGYAFTALGNNPAGAAAVAPAFSAAIGQAVTQEIPLASVAPAFIYRLNEPLGIYEPLTNVPGPLFSERALTLGKGKFNFSLGYSYIDFSELNGTDMDNIRSPALLNEFFVGEAIPFGQLSTGEDVFLAPSSSSLLRTQIDLQAHIIVPTLRYGITDEWDVGISIPIVNTSLRVRNESVRIRHYRK